MEWIVCSAVRELLAKALTDLEPQICCHGDVSLIEQPVEIRAQQQTIRDFVRAVEVIWLDVGGFKHRKRVFLSDGATPSVCLGNSDAEGALSEARAHEEGSSVPRCGLSKKGARAGTIFPYPCALADFQIVLLVCLRPWRPVSWCRDPSFG